MRLSQTKKGTVSAYQGVGCKSRCSESFVALSTSPHAMYEECWAPRDMDEHRHRQLIRVEHLGGYAVKAGL